MNRAQLSALLLPVSLSFGLLAGCGESNPSGIWDSSAMMWEAAPPRNVVGGDASSDGLEGELPGTMPRGFTKPCKGVGEPWCCYDGYNLSGIPLCTWNALPTGTSVAIDHVFLGERKIAPPTPLVLSSTTPERFTTNDDCTQLPVGFVLQGKGLVEEPLLSHIQYYSISKKGFWKALEGSATRDLVLPKNSDPTSRGDAGVEGLPAPKMKLADGLCAEADTVANAVSFEWVKLRIDETDYEINYGREPLGSIRAYYVRIERTY